MKTKGRRCKKVQRVRILLRTLQIARIGGTKRFRVHGYTPTPCFAKKRLESVDKKGLGVENAKKKRLYFVENIEALFAERMHEMTALVAGAGKSWLEGRTGEELDSGRKFDDGDAATIMEHFTSWIS
jgi:hypothetical protein